MTIAIRKGDEKEEYTDTVLREGDSLAEKLPEYGLWKVAFEPESRESRGVCDAGEVLTRSSR